MSSSPDSRISGAGRMATPRQAPDEPAPKDKRRAIWLILGAVAVAAVLLLGGAFLFAPEKVYDPSNSSGTGEPGTPHSAKHPAAQPMPANR